MRMAQTHPLEALIRRSPADKLSIGAEHTPEEIRNQCTLWEETARRMVSQRDRLHRFLSTPTPREIILTGAGSSYYLGRAMTGILQKTHRVRAMAMPATDLMTHPDHGLDPDTEALMISFSRSGDTSESVRAVAETLKHFPRMRHVIITCNSRSKMAHYVDGKNRVLVMVLDSRTCDQGLAMTTSVTNMYLAGLFLAFLEDVPRYRALVRRLARAGKGILEKYASLAHALAERRFPRVAILGSGPHLATALESGLKIKELTDGKVATLAESFLGARHGPITFIDRETMVIYCLSSEPSVRRYELDVVRQIRERQQGAVSIAMTGSGYGGLSDCVDHVLSTGMTGPDYSTVPVYLLFPQMFGLFSSLAYGLRPDNPSRRGAISRVVNGVKIYSRKVK